MSIESGRLSADRRTDFNLSGCAHTALIDAPATHADERNNRVRQCVYAQRRLAPQRRARAGAGRLIYFDKKHLHGPLALALAPNGHLVTANGDAVNPDPQQPSEIVEFTVDGQFVAQMQVDIVPGAAFGLAFGLGSQRQPQFAAINDNTNSATVWTLRLNGNNQQ